MRRVLGWRKSSEAMGNALGFVRVCHSDSARLQASACSPDHQTEHQQPASKGFKPSDPLDSKKAAMPARPIVKVSLRDFHARKQEIAAELWRASTEIGFFCAPLWLAVCVCVCVCVCLCVCVCVCVCVCERARVLRSDLLLRCRHHRLRSVARGDRHHVQDLAGLLRAAG